MDSRFVDLDLLVTRIRNESSKRYFFDAVRCYKAGAYRSSLTSLWVSLAYDLLAKYRELSAQGDTAATQFISGWDTATTTLNVKTLLKLERDLLDHAADVTQIIDADAKRHLNRLREDRHLCAHPAFSAEAELFEPSSELVRLHLVNVIECVLAREPRQGNTIFDFYSLDIQSVGFPTNPALIHDYVEQRYLRQLKVQNIKNFGTVLAKSLIKGIPAEWEPYHAKVTQSLFAIHTRASDAWPDLITTISRLIDNALPNDRGRAIWVIAKFPSIWESLQASTQTALQETARNFDLSNSLDLRSFAGVAIPSLRVNLENRIAGMTLVQLKQAIAVEALPEFWDRAVDLYALSGSFRSSEDNFTRLIAPFAGQITSVQFDRLLQKLMTNGQCWNAGATPQLLLNLLQNARPHDLPTNAARDQFYQDVRRKRTSQEYSAVLQFFANDGWVTPQNAATTDDDE